MFKIFKSVKIKIDKVKGVKMNKGITFDFGYATKKSNVCERAREIKNAGFDCVMTSADPKLKKKNKTLKTQVKAFKEAGLKLSSLHMKYNYLTLPFFWVKGRIGDRIEKSIIKDLKLAKKFGFRCLVVHTTGVWSEVGKERFVRILFQCEKLNIPIALENLSANIKLIEKIFKTFNSNYMKACCDVGHVHAFTPEFDYLTKYKDKIIALHLHDNLGRDVEIEKFEKIGYNSINPDMHTLNKYGNIDWKSVAGKLTKIDYPLNLDYEVLMCYRKNETAQEVLNEVYRQACELESDIQKFKEN